MKIVLFLLGTSFALCAMKEERIVTQTERLKIRWLTLGDVPALKRILGDEQVMKYASRLPMTENEIREFIKDTVCPSYEKNGWGRFAVTNKDGVLIGYAGFAQDTDEPVDVGYGFVKECWRQGFATETVSALVAYARSINIPELTARIYTDNIASKRVVQKTGFTYWKQDSGNKLLEVYRIILDKK